MSTKYKSIKLTEVLQILDGTEENNKPILFINPTSTLETFFTYKANMSDIFKLKINLELHPEKKQDISNEIQNSLEAGMKAGYWVVFNLGKDPNFNLVEFLKNFNFYDKNMFKPNNIKDKKYCLEHKILREENDVDYFGNKGYFDIKNTFKFVFLSTCKENEIETLLKTNNEIEFDVVIAK